MPTALASRRITSRSSGRASMFAGCKRLWTSTERSRDHPAGESGRVAERAPRGGQNAARARFGCRPRRRVPLAGAGAIISRRRERVGLAVCVSGQKFLDRSAYGGGAASSSARIAAAEGDQDCRAQGGHCATGELPRPAPFVCDAPAGSRLGLAQPAQNPSAPSRRVPHGAGTLGTRQRGDHHEIRACPKPPRHRPRQKPLGRRLTANAMFGLSLGREETGALRRC